jgi:CheY-like chemotaxis protein
MASCVLVVDDNPTNLKLACALLETEGYLVERAANAEEAVAILRRTRPGLILMDIHLPDMDGLTLTRKLKANEATKQVPIVALTATAMKGDEQKAYEAGCDGYISKPIDTRKFLYQVKQFLKRTTD